MYWQQVLLSRVNCLRLWLWWIHPRIYRGPLFGWRFIERLLNEREYEPDVAQAEQATCDYAQHPGAFPQAEHLGDAVPGHRQDH